MDPHYPLQTGSRSEPSDPGSSPPAQRKVRSGMRAAKACLTCRRRKVRCDVLTKGQPCSNCHFHSAPCIVAARAAKYALPLV
jgi:hypothetical protein